MMSLLSLTPRTRTYLPSGSLFDRFFDEWTLPSLFNEDNTLIPAFDISENEKEFNITAELPGIDAKDVDITFSEGLLSIKGEKKHENEDEGENYHRIERRYGSFQRSFKVPGTIKADEIDANYKDGVLKLILPKGDGHETKKIEVKK